jgi:hypothetical protein
MNKKQANEQISALFESAFNRETYTHFLRNLLNDVEARDNHYSGNTVPDAYKPHVNQYWRMGKYIDPEQAEVDLYVVEVPTLAKLDRARTALRNFAVRTLKTFGDKDHALIAFYAKEDGGADWRFSYVKIEHSAKMVDGKARIEKELTPAKRYSFLVGEHEQSHTAQAQLVDLLAMDYANPKVGELEAAFSIEKVTKEFFEQYKGLFLRLSEVLAKDACFSKEPNEEKRKQQIAKFAKKLLGQIVFLYFLQKKGWMGVPEGSDWGKGDRRFLQKLFADADGSGQNYYMDKLQYLFYEALANDRIDQFDPTYYQRFECRIPFLNGGLFEADYDWQKVAIALPNSIFSNAEKTKAGDKGTGILDVFNRYNFTIKEDEPLDKEVAVDPEMLGKVFENMLEITERKSKGAYYTPREIVHYMCQESLIHYLAGEVGEETKLAIPKADVETLVRKGIFAIENDQRILDKGKETEAYTFKLPESVRVNAAKIDDALADIRVCDPAIGSGAFPVGMLHEIVHARQALAPHLPPKKPLRPYELKKHTIGHSLYGVDLDPSAIDIARLRLWLSLVVDEDDYTVIDALPNLDYKIMQGNSLIEEYEGIKLFDETFIQEADDPTEQIAALQKEEQAISRDYIALSQKSKLSKDQKKAFDKRLKEIKKLVDKLKNPPKDKPEEMGLFDLVSKAREKAAELERLHELFFAVSSPAEKRQLRNQITALEWELIDATLTEQDKADALSKLAAYRDSGEKPWFLWKLNFSEVFKQKGGFDVVMGNPPYVQIQSLSGQQIQKDMEAQKYETFAKTGDIYCLFYERGHRILRDHATLCFITSNKWMRAKYGEKTRKFFVEKTNPKTLIDFSSFQVFETAAVDTNILLFSKEDNRHQTKACAIEKSFTRGTNLEDYLVRQHVILDNLSSDSWVITSKKQYDIKRRIEEVGTPLKDWDVSIYRGILTGFNEAFIIDSKKRDELIAADPKSAEIIKPILRGRDIKRYYADFADLWLINSHNGYDDVQPIDIEDYPAIKAHLDVHWENLKKRQDKGVTPYNLRNCAYLLEFEKEKIVYPDIMRLPRGSSSFADFPYMYLDLDGFFPEATNFILTGENITTILAMLSSEFGIFAFINYYSGPIFDSKGFRYKKAYLENIPVPRMNSIQLDCIVRYSHLLRQHSAVLPTRYFDQLIDGLVYEIYFPEEIKAAGKELLPHLGTLPALADDMTDEEKLAIIQQEFERLYDPNHPVRNHLETLDSVEEVRIIREALKK